MNAPHFASNWQEIEDNLEARKQLRPAITAERRRSAAVEIHNRFMSDRLIRESRA